MTGSGIFLLLTTLVSVPQAEPPQEDRLFGRVVARDGGVYEGYIHWDRNEGSWADFLHGSKPLSEEHLAEARRLGGEAARDREESVEILGLRISWDEDEGTTSAVAGIRFGHLRSLEVLDDDEALLVLKSGQEVVLEEYSTDLGDGVRGIVVEDPERGRVELEWDDLELVDFMPAPADVSARSGTRLWGTVRVRGDRAFTGYVTWDLDEILTEDVLDGEDDGRDREIPFANVVSIERLGSRSARVVLANGEDVVLDGSNDVNSSNRGILVVDPVMGEVQIEWEDFEDVVFNPAPRRVRYEDFDGGGRLYGTLETEDGEELSGWIRWDNDEEYTWELLDGADSDMEFDIEFGAVESIEKEGRRASLVTLRDGRAFELEDSNDVDDGNKGVFVTPEDGETRMVTWDDFRRIRFHAP